MRIEEIDKNLKINTELPEKDIVWFDAKEKPISLHGVFYDNNQSCYLRMPQNIAESVSYSVGVLNHHTTGGRIRFKTDSPFIAIHTTVSRDAQMSHFTPVGQSGFDMYSKSGKKEIYCHTFMPPANNESVFDSFCYVSGEKADYTINFPLYGGVKELYIAIKEGYHLEKADPYDFDLPIVYYGSSITQGGCASRPGNSYQALISRYFNTDFINLGFSGSCKAEPEMAEYLSDIKMSVFVYDYDHNTPDTEYLNKTHMPLYRKIRSKQPDTPIIIISASDILLSPKTFEERREIVKNTWRTAVDEGDKNVYFIDGASLFEGQDWDACTVDGCHPNDLGFFRMSVRIEKELKPLLIDGSKQK